MPSQPPRAPPPSDPRPPRSTPSSRPPPRRSPPPETPRSSKEGIAGRIGAALLIATMLLVPVGILLAGRSLIPALDRLTALARSSPPESSPEDAGADPHAPRLRVKVTDEDGNPVVGATVRLVSPRAPFDLVGEARTGLTGEASFTTVRLPHVRVVASHETSGVVSSNEVTVDEGDTKTLDLVLSAAEVISGTIVGEDDHPVAGVAIAIEGMPWAVAGGTASDKDGTFRLVTVPHEATTLVAVARGYRTSKVSLAARSEAKAATELVLHIKLVPGAPVEGDVFDPDGAPIATRVVACEGEASEAQTTSDAEGKFELPPSAIGCGVIALSDTFASNDAVVAEDGQRLALRLKLGGGIEGMVVDDRGTAVSPFQLGIESFAAVRGKASRVGAGRPHTFDEGGAFHLDHLAPGTYVLTATATGKPPTRSEPVDVTTGNTARGIRIVLARGGVVSGHVVDDKRAPVGGVDVSFDQVSSTVTSTAHTKTDDTGAYTLEGAPAGPFTVRAEKGGYRMRMVAGLTVASGATLTADITLNPGSGGASMELGGIGASMIQKREGIAFAGVFPGDPADRAGLRAGDIVTRIDGESTESMSLADALQRLRGEAGTTVGVSVKRTGAEGAKETIDAVVVRAVIVH